VRQDHKVQQGLLGLRACRVLLVLLAQRVLKVNRVLPVLQEQRALKEQQALQVHRVQPDRQGPKVNRDHLE
jgi:hypothetical protein